MHKLVALAVENNCSSGPCPTLYRAEDGRLFIQGYRVATEIKGSVKIPEGEDLVEIGPDLLARIKQL